MSTSQEIYKENKFKKIHLSFIFFILVILISALSYYYDNLLNRTNAEIRKVIDEKNKSIDELKLDDNLQIYDLLDNNKNVICRLRAYSEITSYINYLGDLGSIYALEFSGFNFSAGVLTTSVISKTDEATKNRETNYSYNKTAKFIKDYRGDSESKFELGFINSIVSKGNDTESYDLKLTLKDSYINKFCNQNIKESLKSTEKKQKVKKIVETKKEIKKNSKEVTQTGTNL